jgi:hypothetical protein
MATPEPPACGVCGFGAPGGGFGGGS